MEPLEALEEPDQQEEREEAERPVAQEELVHLEPLEETA